MCLPPTLQQVGGYQSGNFDNRDMLNLDAMSQDQYRQENLRGLSSMPIHNTSWIGGAEMSGAFSSAPLQPTRNDLWGGGFIHTDNRPDFFPENGTSHSELDDMLLLQNISNMRLDLSPSPDAESTKEH